MKSSKLVTVIHPDDAVRGSLRLTLERQGYRVATDPSCGSLLSGERRIRPDLILLDRSVLSDEGVDLVSRLSQLWQEAQTLFLPESLSQDCDRSRSLPPLLDVIDRLLGMSSTRELLS